MCEELCSGRRKFFTCYQCRQVHRVSLLQPLYRVRYGTPLETFRSWELCSFQCYRNFLAHEDEPESSGAAEPLCAASH